MITTLRFRFLRMVMMCSALLFIAAVLVLTAQQDEDRMNLRTRVEVQAEKMSAMENWRAAVEASKIPERLATLESQMESNIWLLRGALGGIGLLIMEMLGRLFFRNKKEE